MRLVATSIERYRATAAERRQHGGKTVTVFLVHRAEDANDASKWVKVTGFGPTPGQRKTDALLRAAVLLSA